MKLISGLFLVLLLTSCMTVFNKKTYDMRLKSDRPNATVRIYDSTYMLPAVVKITKEKKNLDILYQQDSIQKKLRLFPVTNPRIWFNFTGFHFAPIGFLVDYLSPKRYYYGTNLRFHSSGDSVFVKNNSKKAMTGKFLPNYFKSDYPGKPGDINFVPGFIHTSAIYINNNSVSREGWAFGGLKAGLEYVYADRKFIGLQAGYVFPVNDLFPGESFDPVYDQKLSSAYAALTNNYAFKRLNFAYGLSFTTTKLHTIDEERYIDQRHKSNMLGIYTSFHYRLGGNFYAGIVYKPDFYRIGPSSDWSYEQLFSFEILCKLPIRKRTQ